MIRQARTRFPARSRSSRARPPPVSSERVT